MLLLLGKPSLIIILPNQVSPSSIRNLFLIWHKKHRLNHYLMQSLLNSYGLCSYSPWHHTTLYSNCYKNESLKHSLNFVQEKVRTGHTFCTQIQFIIHYKIVVTTSNIRCGPGLRVYRSPFETFWEGAGKNLRTRDRKSTHYIWFVYKLFNIHDFIWFQIFINWANTYYIISSSLIFSDRSSISIANKAINELIYRVIDMKSLVIWSYRLIVTWLYPPGIFSCSVAYNGCWVLVSIPRVMWELDFRGCVA